MIIQCLPHDLVNRNRIVPIVSISARHHLAVGRHVIDGGAKTAVPQGPFSNCRLAPINRTPRRTQGDRAAGEGTTAPKGLAPGIVPIPAAVLAVYGRFRPFSPYSPGWCAPQITSSALTRAAVLSAFSQSAKAQSAIFN